MTRDPLYRAIIKALNGSLDPDLFEHCAADLLRDEWPTLVPVRGGRDSGMDGAVADAKGAPFPLVSTTGKNVNGNLKKSLRSYRSSGQSRRRAILATSRELTPQRIQNLHKTAGSLGFTLVGVYTQAAFADRLYNNPRWCRELLNLTGDPPSLSQLPASRRPYVSQTVIGRADDIDWLKKTPGDLLVFGPPGSGKTFVFCAARSHVDGLFVVSQDIAKIANNLRAEKPKALLVDDGHMQLDLIRQLRQLRNDIGASYRILVNCWPGQREEVASTLQVTSSSTRELQLLTRDQIVEVIKGVGIQGPNVLIHELVDQADGRPGLAVTLALLCLRGDVQKVALAEALCTDIQLTFDRLVGRQAINILSAFAVGGEGGMPLNTVANFLGITDATVAGTVTLLAAGGVVNEVNQTTLSVRPEALRHALVRDTFFRGAFSLDIQGLLSLAPNHVEATLTLIGARWRSGSVPDSLLRTSVEKSASNLVWERYAGLGPSEAEWVLQNHPDKFGAVVRSALFHIPGKAIPSLLNAAANDKRDPSSYPNHPIRLIEDWIKSIWGGQGMAVARRRILLETALEWHRLSNNPDVTLEAFRLSLSPDFETSEQDPGMGVTLTLRWGYLSVNELEELSGLWQSVIAFLRANKPTNWRSIQTIVEDWAYLRRPLKDPPRQFLVKKKQIASQFLKDVAQVLDKHYGLLQWAKRTAKTLRVKLELNIDPEYEILFPVEDLRNFQKFQQQTGQRAQALAVKWAQESPREIADRVVVYEREASMSGRTWPRMSPFVFQEIARLSDSPIDWINALIQARASADLVWPFIEEAKNSKVTGLPAALTACFQQESLKRMTAMAVLSMPNPPADLLQHSLSNISGMANAIEFSCMRREVPEHHVLLLLRHEDGEIAAAAAIGEWKSCKPPNVRHSLREAWRQAIIRCVNEDHDIEGLFRADPSLALDWVRGRLKEDNLRAYLKEEAFKQALTVLTIEDRKQLLKELDESKHLATAIIELLVDDDFELYKYLLAQPHLRSFHLAPLKGKPDEESWRQKAQLALDCGYPAEEVAGSVRGSTWGWSGKESIMWDDWAKRFLTLRSHPDQRLQLVGQIGQTTAEELRDRAAEQERKMEVHGRDRRIR